MSHVIPSGQPRWLTETLKPVLAGFVELEEARRNLDGITAGAVRRIAYGEHQVRDRHLIARLLARSTQTVLETGIFTNHSNPVGHVLGMMQAEGLPNAGSVRDALLELVELLESGDLFDESVSVARALVEPEPDEASPEWRSHLNTLVAGQVRWFAQELAESRGDEDMLAELLAVADASGIGSGPARERLEQLAAAVEKGDDFKSNMDQLTVRLAEDFGFAGCGLRRRPKRERARSSGVVEQETHAQPGGQVQAPLAALVGEIREAQAQIDEQRRLLNVLCARALRWVGSEYEAGRWHGPVETIIAGVMGTVRYGLYLDPVPERQGELPPRKAAFAHDDSPAIDAAVRRMESVNKLAEDVEDNLAHVAGSLENDYPASNPAVVLAIAEHIVRGAEGRTS